MTAQTGLSAKANTPYTSIKCGWFKCRDKTADIGFTEAACYHTHTRYTIHNSKALEWINWW